MKLTYKKWLWSAIIVSAIGIVLNIVSIVLLWIGAKQNNSTLQSVIPDIASLYGRQSMTIQEVVQHLISNLVLSTIASVYLLIVCIKDVKMTVQQYSNVRHGGWVTTMIVLFLGGIGALIGFVLYEVACVKAYRQLVGMSQKEQQLFNAKSYAEKLKSLRDKGEISQEEFLERIGELTSTMDTLMEQTKENKNE